MNNKSSGSNGWMLSVIVIILFMLAGGSCDNKDSGENYNSDPPKSYHSQYWYNR